MPPACRLSTRTGGVRPDHVLLVPGRAAAEPAGRPSRQCVNDEFLWRHARFGQLRAHTHLSTNDTAGALAAAVAGLGIVATTSWASRSEIQNWALARLLPDWKMAELPVHAYFPMGRTTRMAGRAFVDFIAAELKKAPFDCVAGPWPRRSPLAPGTRSGGTCSFGQEPDAFVGFIDPVFQQARRGDIAVLIAHVVKLVHMSDQRQIIVT